MAGTRTASRPQGNNTNYVQYNFGSATKPAAGIFDARFLFRPNGKRSTGQDIFMAASNTNYNIGNQLHPRPLPHR